jgi:hypothetical protein
VVIVRDRTRATTPFARHHPPTRRPTGGVRRNPGVSVGFGFVERPGMGPQMDLVPTVLGGLIVADDQGGRLEPARPRRPLPGSPIADVARDRQRSLCGRTIDRRATPRTRSRSADLGVRRISVRVATFLPADPEAGGCEGLEHLLALCRPEVDNGVAVPPHADT